MLIFGGYAALLLAVVIAGFIGHAVGIWASVLWGTVLIGGLVFCARRRLRRPQVAS
jgi:prevent-host-death family protein